MAKISTSVVVGVLLILAMVSCVVVDAAKIETFIVSSCDGTPTNTFLLNGGCQNFNGQSAAAVSEIGSNVRVSFHNQQSCTTASSIAQRYGPGCVVAANTETVFRSVFVDE